MKSDKHLNRGGIVYASPLIFAAACVLLAMIIGVFAVNNYQREKKLMSATLEREAATILNLVSAGSRGAQRRGFMRGDLSSDDWLQTIGQAIENSAEHPGLLALYLIDDGGVIRAHSDQNLINTRAEAGIVEQIAALSENNLAEIGGIVKGDQNREPLYRMTAVYRPARLRDAVMQNPRGRMGRMMGDPPGPATSPEEMAGGPADHFVMVAELSLEQYHKAVRKQLLQIVVLSVVLLLVGVGGLLSLILLQTFKGSQTRLREMSTFTDVLVSSLPVGLIATDFEAAIKTCNRSAAQMLNIDQNQCIGKSLTEVFDGKLVDLLNGQPSGKTCHWEVQPPGEQSTIRSLHLSRREIEDDLGRNLGTMLLIQDLSQLRELENQLQRAARYAAVGKMAAGVAHELRNPLSSIKGLALLLKSRFNRDESARETADLMVDEVERLNRSISELLDYARPVRMQRVGLVIDELLGRAVRLIRSDAEAAQVEILENYRCGPASIIADEDKLTQVVLNLCLNSIQAMQAGGRLSLTTSLDDRLVTVAIGDTGSGIAPEIQEKIFEPYFTTKHDGTGLGLAMSAKIIEDHHGSIEIDSAPLRGTTVILRLPRQ